VLKSVTRYPKRKYGLKEKKVMAYAAGKKEAAPPGLA
jgi:hypothetical protein